MRLIADIYGVLDFLLNLKRVSLGSHWHFAFGVPQWQVPLWLLAALAVGVAGFFSYRSQSVSKRRRVVLGVLRGVALALVLLLFCRPQMVVDQELVTPGVVAVWLDNSLSMTLRDPYAGDDKMASILTAATVQTANGPQRPTRYELAIHALDHAHPGWLQDVLAKQQVALFTGATRAELLGPPAKTIEELTAQLSLLKARQPDGEATDVPAVVSDVLRQLQGQPISAVVLLTDGQTNTGASQEGVEAMAQQNLAAIFALPMGQKMPPLNVALNSMEVPENTFVRDPVGVKVKVQATGLSGPATVHVSLYKRVGGKPAGAPLAHAEVAVDPSKSDYDVQMLFKPAAAEHIDLIAVADPLGEELNASDNMVTGTTNVLDAKITALYVEGYPRWEFRYLKNELIREKTMRVSTLLLSADEAFAQEGTLPITRFPETPEEINKYDVLIIGDVDPQYFSPTQRKLIVDWVAKKGGGLLMIAGQQFAPDAYKNTVLEPLLPIKPDDPNLPIAGRSDGSPFRLVATGSGKASNLFRFFEEAEKNEAQVGKLPEMFWYKPVVGLMPSAEVYAVHPEKTSGGVPVPLLVVGRYGKGTTMFSAVADTWRWRFYDGEPLYQSYWLQVMRLLFREKALSENSQLALSAGARSVTLNDTVTLSLKVNDPTLLPVLPLQVQLAVNDDSGAPMEPVALSRVQNTSDEFTGIMPATRLGKFNLRPTPGALPIELQPLQVDVRPPDRELAQVTANTDSLERLARVTHGSVLPLYRQDELSTLIPDRSLQRKNDLTEELWNKPVALLLIVILLSAEWFTRKAAGLM